MKRKMRRFEEGGLTDEADDMENMPGMSRYSGGRDRLSGSTRRGESEDEPKTFAQAFAKARANKQATFTFTNPKTGKTDTYNTRTKGEEDKEDAAPKKEKVGMKKLPFTPSEDKGGKKNLPYIFDEPTKFTPPTSRARPKGKLPEGYRPKVGSGRYDDPTSTYAERVFSPLRKLGDVFGLRKEERVMRDMGVSREEARRRLQAKEDVEEMRRGGRVKKYAKGGSTYSSASKRADGIAQRGKTRGKMC